MKKRSNPIRYYAMLIRVLTAPFPGHQARPGARTAEPVTFGVPLPKGAVMEPKGWRIRTGPVQTTVLDRWSDRSARWVLVDAQIDRQSTEHEVVELETAGAVEDTSTTIQIVEAGESVTVRTGAAVFRLARGNSFPFAEVRSGEKAVIGPGDCHLAAVDADGARSEAMIERISIELRGPLRSVVKLDGRLAAGHRVLDLSARVHFYAGLSTVRVTVTLTNPEPARHKGGFWDLGDPGSVLLKDFRQAITFKRPVDSVACSLEPASAFAETAMPLEIYQDSSGGEQWKSSNHVNQNGQVPLTFRGYRIRSGGAERLGIRATPVVALRSGELECGVALRHFWQNFPKALEVTGTGVNIALFPEQSAYSHELQGGEQKTHDYWLTFGGDRVSPEPLDWCRSPTIACVDPEWTMASGAVPFLARLAPAHLRLVTSAVDGPDRFESKREVIDEFGWRHFGEIYGDHEAIHQANPPLVSHYNNQYDAIAGLTLQYLRSADPRWWTMADDLAGHVVDIDIYHTQADKSAYNGGMFWHTYHYGDAGTATHRTYPSAAKGRIHGGGPSADHNYTTGLMLHYFLTGSDASKAAAVDLARFVTRMDDGRLTPFRWLDSSDTGRPILSAAGYHGPGRGAANSLNALLDGHRLTGDRGLMAKAEELIRRVVHPDEDISRHRLDSPDERWFYVMFLQALGKYLGDKLERGELDEAFDYARASLLHYADWMTANERPWLDQPERLQFPTESWAASELRKSDVFFLAAIYATNQTARAKYRERGTFFFHYGIDKTLSMPTHVKARPQVMALVSGHLSATTDIDFQILPAPDRRWPVQSVFVPQRERAKRRLVQLGAAAAALGFAAVILLLML